MRLTQLDDVSNHAHDQEAHADCLADAQKLAAVRYSHVLDYTLPCDKGMFMFVRLLHRTTNCRPSFRKSRGISRSSFAWSMVAGACVGVSQVGELRPITGVMLLSMLCLGGDYLAMRRRDGVRDEDSLRRRAEVKPREELSGQSEAGCRDFLSQRPVLCN